MENLNAADLIVVPRADYEIIIVMLGLGWGIAVVLALIVVYLLTVNSR